MVSLKLGSVISVTLDESNLGTVLFSVYNDRLNHECAGASVVKIATFVETEIPQQMHIKYACVCAGLRL